MARKMKRGKFNVRHRARKTGQPKKLGAFNRRHRKGVVRKTFQPKKRKRR